MEWIFGYGSLVWRPAFPFAESRTGFIRGWQRRFWQGSTDHRGVPGAPGRVVTLLPDAEGICWGRAYRIDVAHHDQVFAALDHREKGGYERRAVSIETAAGTVVDGVTYIADHRNGNFLGPASLAHVAAQVLRSTGPSGGNVDYVMQLDEALREMGAYDVEVHKLAEVLRAWLDKA